MFITRKKMKKKITDTYNKGFHIGKLYGVILIDAIQGADEGV